MVVTPGEAQTHKANVKKVSIANETREKTRFVLIRVRSTLFEVMNGEDGTEVPGKKPGEMNVIDSNKSLP